MQINFDSIIFSLDEKPIPKGDVGFITLRSIAMLCLGSDNKEQDHKMSYQQKMDIYNLTNKIHKSKGLLEITAAEADLLKQRLTMFCTPFFLGRAIDIMEGRTIDKSETE